MFALFFKKNVCVKQKSSATTTTTTTTATTTTTTTTTTTATTTMTTTTTTMTTEPSVCTFLVSLQVQKHLAHESLKLKRIGILAVLSAVSHSISVVNALGYDDSNDIDEDYDDDDEDGENTADSTRAVASNSAVPDAVMASTQRDNYRSMVGDLQKLIEGYTVMVMRHCKAHHTIMSLYVAVWFFWGHWFELYGNGCCC